jgi:hypothetical protein
MGSRIRGRRYKHVDPDERYGFVADHAAHPDAAPADGPIVIAIGPISLDATTLEGVASDPARVQVVDVSSQTAAVTVDGTTVTVESFDGVAGTGAPSVRPQRVTGPSQAEG